VISLLFQKMAGQGRYIPSSGRFFPFLMILGTSLLCLGFSSGCSCEKKDSSPPPTTASKPAEKTPAKKEAPALFHAPVKVVNREGDPLPGIVPIATRSANAFDSPLAEGRPTGPDGLSGIRLSLTEKIAIRAWDPSLFFFPNNFYDVLPGSGNPQKPLVITMVEAAAVEAELILPDGRPAAHENTGLMMFHPVHGPWWPADGESNEKGEVIFRKVPPGSFILRLKVASGPTLETGEQFIAPGEHTHLGRLQLMPEQKPVSAPDTSPADPEDNTTAS
jgi:hypothetical protein